ncbi:restriction endonuclease subunit S [Ruminococcoides sp. CLA-AA-H171]|jgi:type I restriction enzyme S subunit|uniref:Restriction endonuclease subunit S n=1 Tax=Ruminococcoides intestinihominis TaxID=3133161 RepID=A0ABV1HU62_9FIRM
MYRTIDELVEKVDERNTENKISKLIGVSIDKCFIKSVANTNGTDLSKYKVIRKNDFAVSLMQVSRDSKIPIARLEDYDVAIMSPAYPIFRVKDTSVVLPEYLEMWFKRPEFDREAAFIAVGGVRGSMPWEEFAKMKLPVPPIEKQLKIVNAYKIVTDRIALKQKINDNLEATAQAILQDKIYSNGIETTVDNLINLFDSMRRPLSGLERSEMKHTYPYYGAASLMDYVDNYIFDGVYGLLGEDGTVMDDNGYPTMQYVWGKFWVNNHAHIFQGKNGYSTEMVYLILKNTIVRNAVTGAVQLKINQENLRKLSVVVPCDDNLTELNILIDKVFLSIRENRTEIQYLINLKDILLAELSD